MKLAINKKTLKITYEVTGQNNHVDIIWLNPVVCMDNNGCLATSGKQISMDLGKYNKDFRTMIVW